MLLFKNLETYIEETLKTELNATELTIIIQAMEAVNIKGSDAIVFGKLLERLNKTFEKTQKKETVTDAIV